MSFRKGTCICWILYWFALSPHLTAAEFNKTSHSFGLFYSTWWLGWRSGAMFCLLCCSSFRFDFSYPSQPRSILLRAFLEICFPYILSKVQVFAEIGHAEVKQTYGLVAVLVLVALSAGGDTKADLPQGTICARTAWMFTAGVTTKAVFPMVCPRALN